MFNNNHSRQTTSIPYMQNQQGTVYKELSNNQVVSGIKNEEGNTAADTKINSHNTQT
jgi:hypothetical protein